MAWRSVLTFADGSDAGIARARMASALAEAHQAHLDVDVVVLLLQPLYGVGAATFAAYFEEARRASRLEGAEAVARLRAALQGEAAVETQETFPETVGAFAAAAARASDVVVLGQPKTLTGSEPDAVIFRGALMGGGRPCLLLPPWSEPQPWGRRVLVAWKGTPEAARALQGALPLLRAAETVRLWQANPRSRREGEDPRSMARLAAHLSRHGVPIEEPAAIVCEQEPEQAIVAELDAFGADLLVMGAYSRPRIQELLFGGMTTAMVPTARTPLLLAH